MQPSFIIALSQILSEGNQFWKKRICFMQTDYSVPNVVHYFLCYHFFLYYCSTCSILPSNYVIICLELLGIHVDS